MALVEVIGLALVCVGVGFQCSWYFAMILLGVVIVGARLYARLRAGATRREDL